MQANFIETFTDTSSKHGWDTNTPNRKQSRETKELNRLLEDVQAGQVSIISRHSNVETKPVNNSRLFWLRPQKDFFLWVKYGLKQTKNRSTLTKAKSQFHLDYGDLPIVCLSARRKLHFLRRKVIITQGLHKFSYTILEKLPGLSPAQQNKYPRIQCLKTKRKKPQEVKVFYTQTIQKCLRTNQRWTNISKL